MKQILVAISLLATISCMAQDPPPVVKSAFAKSFPGVTAKKWDKEDSKYEANFTKNGKRMSATFTADGILEETETSIIINDLPYAVTNYVETHYKGAHIKEAAIIVRGNDNMYEAEVKGKDLLFNMQGMFLKEEED